MGGGVSDAESGFRASVASASGAGSFISVNGGVGGLVGGAGGGGGSAAASYDVTPTSGYHDPGVAGLTPNPVWCES